MGAKDIVFIIVAKDKGSYDVVAPHAEQAKRDGYDVRIVTEGLAAHYFLDGGFDLDFMGTEDFREAPFPFDASSYLRGRVPRDKKGVVIVGDSSPANLEIAMGKAVRELNIEWGRQPLLLVECQGFWRSHMRLPGVQPYLVLTLDEYSRELLLADHPYLTDEDVAIVGNIGAREVQITPEVCAFYIELRRKYDAVFYYTGGGAWEWTGSELYLLAACLEKTPGNPVLVVGYHPKHIKGYAAKWKALVAEYPDRMIEAAPRTGDQWAALADLTLSGYSTTMTTAVYYQKAVAALYTPATLKWLKREANLDESPLVTLGCAHVIKHDAPTDLSQLGIRDPEAYKKIKPYDPDLAYQAVVERMNR